MKKSVPVISFILCAIAMLAVVGWDYQQLPDRPATHFDIAGNPDGWSSREAFAGTMAACGLGLALLVTGIVSILRFLPPSLLNVPHRDYWRQPQNYRTACNYLRQTSLWLGCAMMLWNAALFHLVTLANLSPDPFLDTPRVLMLGIGLLSATIVWVAWIIRWFSRNSPAGGAAAASTV